MTISLSPMHIFTTHSYVTSVQHKAAPNGAREETWNRPEWWNYPRSWVSIINYLPVDSINMQYAECCVGEYSYYNMLYKWLNHQINCCRMKIRRSDWRMTSAETFLLPSAHWAPMILLPGKKYCKVWTITTCCLWSLSGLILAIYEVIW